MTQHERNIINLKNADRLFVEPDPEARPQRLHNKWCECPWCKEEREEEQ